MSEAFDWSLKQQLFTVDMDTYLALPEDEARNIEVKDGMIVHCQSPSPSHSAIGVSLQMAFRDAMRKRPAEAPFLRVRGDVDMLVSDVPFHFKRPDVILYRCIEDPKAKWKDKPTVQDTILVVEIVSPTTRTVDLVDKRAEYALYGIPHYWIVRMANDDGPAVKIEMLVLNSDGTYVTQDVAIRPRDGVGVAIDTLEPLELKVTWEDLNENVD
ncbi:Uma2 family endonuclease [Actinomadura adrarensis]|uniref:Uma2 family endonuclease n=1 Tax=Actinomadura adrarensis TaxID=1819600 RepID=A0ABW3CRT7_9ACTN